MLVSFIHQHGSAIYRSPPFWSHCFSYFKITLKSAHSYLYRCNTTHTYTLSVHPFLVYSLMALWVIRTCRPKPQSSPTDMCPSGQHPKCNSSEHWAVGGVGGRGARRKPSAPVCLSSHFEGSKTWLVSFIKCSVKCTPFSWTECCPWDSIISEIYKFKIYFSDEFRWYLNILLLMKGSWLRAKTGLHKVTLGLAFSGFVKTRNMGASKSCYCSKLRFCALTFFNWRI